MASFRPVPRRGDRAVTKQATMTQSGPPDDLRARITAAQARQAGRLESKGGFRSAAAGYGAGMRMVLDLVGGVVVGLIFGRALDLVAKTEPWGLIFFLLLGMATGFWNMIRTAKRFAGTGNETATPSGPEAGTTSEGQGPTA